jgi:hypothetical protein
MNAKTVFAVIIILTLLFSAAYAAEVKPGWSRKIKENAIRGCAIALMERHMEAIRKGLYKPEEDVSMQVKKATPEIKKKYTATCRCVIEKASQRWSLHEFDEISKDQCKWHKFLTGLFCSKACTLPFESPLNCP